MKHTKLMIAGLTTAITLSGAASVFADDTNSVGVAEMRPGSFREMDMSDLDLPEDFVPFDEAHVPDGIHVPENGELKPIEFDEEGNMISGRRPEEGMPPMMHGERPEFAEGERPELPEGERPEFAEGERPELPEGERPELPEGERPEFTEGERPELPEGEMPQMDGQMPEFQGRMPAFQQNGVGENEVQTREQNGMQPGKPFVGQPEEQPTEPFGGTNAQRMGMCF